MKKYNLKKLLDDYNIIIPAMQRDYAQGRKGKENIREVFLHDLKDSMDNNINIELNIVFGYKEHENTFVPIDGQQRLTTLWLLYWYVAYRANKLEEQKSRLGKFKYEIRDRVMLFCENLLTLKFFESIKDKNLPTICICDYIKNQYWFMNDWIQDPTIQSMMRMLGGDIFNDKNENKIDCIEKLFKGEIDFTKYYNILYNCDDNCCISFQLECNENIDSESYIKMNARGINLTNYEKLKADFIGKVEDVSINNKSICQYLDCEWSDLLWKYIKNDENKPQWADRLLYRWLNEMHFIYKLCFDRNCKDLDEFYNNEIKIDSDKIYYENYKLYLLNNNNYNELSQIIFRYMYYMDKIMDNFQLLDEVNELILPFWERNINYIYFGKIVYDKNNKINDTSALDLDERFKIIGLITFFNSIYDYDIKYNIDLNNIIKWIKIWMTFTIDYIENKHISSFEEFTRHVKNYIIISKDVLTNELFDLNFNINTFSLLLSKSYEKNSENKYIIDSQYIKYKTISRCPSLSEFIFGKDGLENEEFFKGNLNVFLKTNESIDNNNIEGIVANRIKILKGLFVNRQDDSYLNVNHKLAKDHLIFKLLLATYSNFENLKKEGTFPFIGVDHRYNCILRFISDKQCDLFLNIVDKANGNIDILICEIYDLIENLEDISLKKVINNEMLYSFIDIWNSKTTSLANIRDYDNKYYIHMKNSQSEEKRQQILDK